MAAIFLGLNAIINRFKYIDVAAGTLSLFQHWRKRKQFNQYNDVIIGAMASQITSLTIVYSSIYSGADQRKHQSSASLASVRESTGHRWIPRTYGQ